jgi:FAD/FMN-containing dehydrogenase
LHGGAKDISSVVYDIVMSLCGAFSAEHSIGQVKIDLLERMRPSLELELMTLIKSALDPKTLMNLEKIFARQSEAVLANPAMTIALSK